MLRAGPCFSSPKQNCEAAARAKTKATSKRIYIGSTEVYCKYRRRGARGGQDTGKTV